MGLPLNDQLSETFAKEKFNDVADAVGKETKGQQREGGRDEQRIYTRNK